MIVRKVTDKEFRRYGQVIEGVDFSQLLTELGKIKDTENVEYEASYQPL